MHTLNLTLTIIGTMILIIGVLANLIKNRWYISAPIVALLVGVLVGPTVFGLLDVANWGDQTRVLEEAARLTLGISLMGVALRLPDRYLWQHWRSVAILLGLVMPLMWLVSGALAYLFLGVPFWVALLIGAVVTPTDPVVSSSIVTGDLAEKNIPGYLRHVLSSESGANDGLAFPFVMLPILFLTRPPGEALTHWLTYTLLWEVLAAVLIGRVIGYLVGHVQQQAQRTFPEHTEQISLLSVTLALSLTVLGVVKLMGSDGILAVFAAGIMLNRVVKGQEKAEQEQIQDVVRRFFDLPVFVLLGMVLPWAQWIELGWAAVWLVVAVLLLRRLPALVAFSPLMGQVQRRSDALFLGWFGPIGIAALFYATMAVRETQHEIVWIAGSLIITASILVHGVSATPLTRLYGRMTRHAAADSQEQKQPKRAQPADERMAPHPR